MKHTPLYLLIALLISYSTTNAQITSAMSGNWSNPTTWTGGTIPDSTKDVVIASGHTITLDITTASCKNLTVGGGSATLKFANDGSISAISIFGNLLIQSGGRVRNETRAPAGATNSFVEHKLTLYGNLTNQGTIDLRGGSTSAGTSNGTSTFLLGNTTTNISLMNINYLSSGEEFGSITVNKTGGAKVLLNSGNLFQLNSSTVGAVYLTLINGMIETKDSCIWVYLATNGSGIIGAGPERHIRGTLGRGMNNSGGTEKKFEIGDSLGYLPVIVRTTTGGVASGHYMYARIIRKNPNTGSSTFSGGIDSLSKKRYYHIGYSKAGITTAAPSMSIEQFTPTYNENDGFSQSQLGVMNAYSLTNRSSWVNCGPPNHVVDISAPPTEVQSSTISPAITLNDGAALQLAFGYGVGSSTGPIPDSSNASYGPFTMNKYDFWKAPSATPTPLVVHIHGGGLTQGNKSDISLSFVTALLEKGISVMSINYRLTPEVVIPQHYKDCARAIQYVRQNAAAFNVNPNKIGASGSSAGALTAFWLGFYNDLADPTNADPVLRQSSRLKGMACWSGQTSIDTRVIGNWCGPYVLQFSYFNGAVFGLPMDSMNTPTAYAMMEMASPYQHVTTDDPPVWMYYSTVDTPTNSSQAIHHINFGRYLKMRMDSLSLECTLLDPTYTGGITSAAADFFARVLNTTDIEGKKNEVINNYSLEQNYPNPFNPATIIQYTVHEAALVTLKVYDVLGNHISTLAQGLQQQGIHSVNFNGANLASGVYYYTLTTNGKSLSRKMILIK